MDQTTDLFGDAIDPIGGPSPRTDRSGRVHLCGQANVSFIATSIAELRRKVIVLDEIAGVHVSTVSLPCGCEWVSSLDRPIPVLDRRTRCTRQHTDDEPLA